MSKARTLADFISDGSEFADGTISVAEVSGAAPLASPTFTGTVGATTITSTAGLTLNTTDANGTGIALGLDGDKKVRFYDDQGATTKMYWNASTVTQKFEDNSKLVFGSSEDLQLYHNGQHSFVQDAGEGNLYLRTNGVAVVIDDGTNNLAAFNATSGESALYYGGSGKKLATTSTGLDITGDVGATTATITGTVTAGQYDSTEALPDIRPSLLLDFANSKTLDPRITFARGSTATYWDGKTTTKAEENLITYSQDLGNANTPFTNVEAINTILSTATAPDGTSTASILRPTSAGGVTHRIYTGAISGVTGNSQTYTFYAKADGFNNIGAFLNGPDQGVLFDLSNGTASDTPFSPYTGSTFDITSVGNGWYRCRMTATGSAVNNAQLQVWDNSGQQFYAGNNSDAVLIWGVQLESRSSATAYTATTSSPIVKYQPTLQTAASGEARFDHDPATSESKGLLVEESRTNLATYSEVSLGFFGGNLSGVEMYANAGIAPDGTHTADLLRQSSVNEHQSVYAGIGGLSGNTAYTRSCYFKSRGARYVALMQYDGFTNRGTTYDLQDGVVVTTEGSATGTIEDVGNGWFRCSQTYTTTASATSERIQIALPSGGNNTFAHTGDGWSGVLFWGWQLEQGHGTSSYIPTSGSTVTRSADDASIALTNEVNLQEATVYAEAATYRAYANETAWCPVWQLNDGVSSSNGVFDVRAYQITHGTQAVINNGLSGSTDLLKDSQTVTNGEFYKYGLFWDKGSVSFYKNGTLVNSTTNQYANPSWDSLDIGWADRGGRKLDGHIKKLSVYPQALSSNTMIAITEE